MTNLGTSPTTVPPLLAGPPPRTSETGLPHRHAILVLYRSYHLARRVHHSSMSLVVEMCSGFGHRTLTVVRAHRTFVHALGMLWRRVPHGPAPPSWARLARLFWLGCEPLVAKPIAGLFAQQDGPHAEFRPIAPNGI
jgi:hypothetical protein